MKIVSLALINILMGTDQAVVASLELKSVTTSIATQIEEMFGGILPIIAVVVISIGIFGDVAGPFIMDKTGIHNRIVRGLVLGASANGIGIARAIEIEVIEGVISGLTIRLIGVAIAIMVPIVKCLYI